MAEAPEIRADNLCHQASLTDGDILELSRKVFHTQLHDFGEKLGFGLTEVDNLEHQYQRDTQRVAETLLHRWRTREPAGFASREIAENILCSTNPHKQPTQGYVIDAQDKMITPNVTVRDCRVRLVDHYKQTVKIHLHPGRSDNFTEMSDMHTKISLHIKDRGRRGGQETRKRPLEGSVNDVFKTKVAGSLPYRIVMLGDAGYGKTTMISKISLDWANGHADSPVKDVPLLFALKFRKEDKKMSLGGAINTQLLGHMKDMTAEAVDKFISDNEEDCMVLLDGYDESSQSISCTDSEGSLIDLLLCRRFKKCRVLVTTRPHREEDFDQEDLPKWYTKMEIEGFAKEDVEKYIDRFFTSSPQECKGLNKYLQTEHEIGSLVTIPFFCMTFCTLWKGGKLQNAHTMTEIFNRLLHYLLQHTKSKLAAKVPDDFTPERIKSVIRAIGKVALQSLLSDSKKFVFSGTDFQECGPDLQVAVTLGLLSQQTFPSESDDFCVTENTYLEFYHKLAQEHCAGVYLSQLSAQDLKSVLDSIDSVVKLGELEFVLRFTAGSSAASCLQIIRYLSSVREKYRQCPTSYNHTYLLNVLSESTAREMELATVLLPQLEDETLMIPGVSGSTISGLHKLPQSIKRMVR